MVSVDILVVIVMAYVGVIGTMMTGEVVGEDPEADHDPVDVTVDDQEPEAVADLVQDRHVKKDVIVPDQDQHLEIDAEDIDLVQMNAVINDHTQEAEADQEIIASQENLDPDQSHKEIRHQKWKQTVIMA